MLSEKGTISYADVGTSYDYWVSAAGDGRFRIEASLDRSSVAATNVENIKPKNIPVEGPENPRINSVATLAS